MAKKKTTKKRTTTRKTAANGNGNGSADGKHLVIVESPAKARTINKYLGRDYVVKASVGHVRDLPKRNPKGVKAPVPGVDIEHGFAPTYEVIQGKGKTVTDLKREAKKATDVWLATDLDREGEAIAWHLAEALNVGPERARRVVFNAITQDAIRTAFEQPRSIDMDKVHAQQARRILDRIVGYQVSPLLWKKVAGGLSAGRVQSVAVRLVVDREREIDAFTPEEYWKITGYFTVDPDKADALSREWLNWLAEGEKQRRKDPKARSEERTIRERNAWLNEHRSLSAELIEVAGKRFNPKNAEEALKAAELAGFKLEEEKDEEDLEGKGPAAVKRTLIGSLADDAPEYRVLDIATKRTKSRPYPPLITSTLQQSAATRYGFPAASTMRTAQQLYEGVEIKGQGSVGLITYMRTDSTHLSPEAIKSAREHIESNFGSQYLPEKPNRYRSSNKAAQEAHEAIRPTDVTLTPNRARRDLDDRQFKLYKLIWERFVACQMVPAQWDSTTVRLGAKPNGTDVVFKCHGRTLAFDGFYRVAGVPSASNELTLPDLREDQPLGPLQIDPRQKFTSPPPRYTEASLVKKLEAEGIGRPSTYASIIKVIQDRKYVEKLGSAFRATDLGEVVTDKLVEAFPKIMEIGYTRDMEDRLDAIEEHHRDWAEFLAAFYGPFKVNLEEAHKDLQHAKAETEPAPYKCPECEAETMYRFGKNGRFLSCSRYPECKYAAPVDREGKPQPPEMTDIACPECGSQMQERKGRYGPFLSCSRYPECKGVVNLDRKGHVKHPSPPPLETDLPCPKCEAPLVLRRSKRGPWLACSRFPKCRGRLGWTKVEEKDQQRLEKALQQHEHEHPQPTIKTIDGDPVGQEYTPQSRGVPPQEEPEPL